MTMQRTMGILGLLAVLACLAGCPPRRAEVEPPRPAVMPEYRELVQRYNRQLEHFDQLWARAEVELTYYNQRGRRKTESGDDSRLMLVMPSKVALSVGKLGQEILWAGCDGEQYWVFDLTEDKQAWIGRADRAIAADADAALPVPVSPARLPQLLGVTKLDADAKPLPPEVEWAAGRYVIEPPGTGTRISIHPQSYLATRVDLIDEAGRSLMHSRLSEHGKVEMPGVPQEQWPVVARRIEIRLAQDRRELRLQLSDLSDGRQRSRIKARLFDLPTLLRTFEPREVHREPGVVHGAGAVPLP